MDPRYYLVFLSIVATQLVCAYNGPDDRSTLRFKVSARALDDKDPLGTSDPYVIISSTEGDGKNEKEFARSATLTNGENPDWGDVFTFEWDRKKNQRWHFVVYDHDVGRNDDTLGYVWVTVNDFVDARQYLQVNLVKKGYLIIQKAS